MRWISGKQARLRTHKVEHTIRERDQGVQRETSELTPGEAIHTLSAVIVIRNEGGEVRRTPPTLAWALQVPIVQEQGGAGLPIRT